VGHVVNASRVEVVGIPCAEPACAHARGGRCTLAMPVATQQIHWIFALSGCPMARAYADLVGRAARRFGLELAPRGSRTAPMDHARLRALEAHHRDAAPVGSRILDRLIAHLRGGGSGEDLERRVEPLLRTRGARTATPAARAGLAALLLIAGLAFYGLVFKPAAVEPPHIVSAQAMGDLGALAPAAEIALTVEVRGPLYIAAFLVPDAGVPQRLFPPLGTPAGLPWPLDPEGGGARYRIPPAGGWRAPATGGGWIVLAAGEKGAPDLGPALDAAPRTAAAVQNAHAESIVLRYEVRNP
jgi:hypothetical protein